MSDTPRTDADRTQIKDINSQLVYVNTSLLCKQLERELNDTNSRMVELKHKQASLIAAINTAITEFPSNQASIYLSGIMEKLFQK